MLPTPATALASLRSTVREAVPSPVAASVRRLLGVLSVTRAGGLLSVAIVAYFVFVVPRELAILLSASMAGAALIGLVPLVVVVAIVRAPI